ncbi:MAG: hypothetical protein A2Y21_05685 [Clostridiales bacterium GWC2_40_7]|nr:MAG: hypothetical protein A2Y21_05685 [Clostridiales bacterium GWC2_40_7]
MTSKEIIKHCISLNNPERIGLDFNAPHHSDILWKRAADLESESNAMDWGYHDEVLKRVPGFNGEVMTDEWGIFYSRLEKLTKGEPIKGALEDDWEALTNYVFPKVDYKYFDEIKPELIRKGIYEI